MPGTPSDGLPATASELPRPVEAPVVRIAIIGSGGMARTRASNIAALPDARLVAVASRNVETGAALARAYGCAFSASTGAVLDRDDLDAVVICAPNAVHGEIVLKTLRRGLPTLVEYPLALDGAQAAAAVAAARAGRLPLRVGYEQVHLGPHEAVRDAVTRHGPPIALSTCVLWPGGPARSPFRNTQIGGAPAQVKSYYLYAVLDWLGEPDGYTTAARYQGYAADGHYPAAAQHAVLTYPRTVASLSWVVGPDVGARQRIQMELVWTDRVLRGDGRTVVERDAEGEHPVPLVRAAWSEATMRGLRDFVEAVRTRTLDERHLDLALLTARIAGT